MRSISWILWCSLLTASACGQQSTQRSELKITNGLVIAENARPEVVNLYRRVFENGKLKGGATCTATWIGENTLITAAHCTGEGPTDENGKVLDLELMVFEITDHSTMPKATKLVSMVAEAYRNTLWDVKKGFNRYDLAILRTAPKTADERPRGLAELSRVAPQKGDAIEIIGYGFYDMSTFGKKGDDRKRIGTNSIAEIKDGFINITGELKNKGSAPDGELASAGNGDSGGPMFRNGELIGVASGGGSGGLFSRGEASYVDLNSAESQTFLARFGF